MATDHGHDPHGADPHGHGPVNHETTDIHLDGVAKMTIGFAVFMLVTILAMYGAFRWLASREAVGQREVGSMVEQASVERPPMMNTPNRMVGTRTPAGPKLLTNEPDNLGEFKAEQSTHLHSYGWVDRANQVVHLPIERAIELTIERGLPVAAAAEPMPMEGEAPADAGETAPETTPAETPAAPAAPPVAAGHQ